MNLIIYPVVFKNTHTPIFLNEKLHVNVWFWLFDKLSVGIYGNKITYGCVMIPNSVAYGPYFMLNIHKNEAACLNNHFNFLK